MRSSVARWLWARLVQQLLDEFVVERNSARIRKQRRSHLPTGDCPNEFWFHPEEWDMEDCLVPVPRETAEALLDQHTLPAMFQFVSDEMEVLCENLYTACGTPKLTVLNTWEVYARMLLLTVTDDN